MATKKAKKHSPEEQFFRDFGQRRFVDCTQQQIAAWLEVDEIVDSRFPDAAMIQWIIDFRINRLVFAQ